ncbi:permease [Candidatus Omnitrophus magneticus]|uniref:Permease n=1 Tax=Candidatus Omnitrophus magneticus TaxID=1609969 RepID=A0A0F0CQ83_9BACT|nr:permease [Candidatus Omnitrophus magneticus]
MIMTHIKNIILESYNLLSAMAPYLLFGFFFAGILHMFINPKILARHTGKNSFFSVLKASIFGIPLPLCSCGVLPAAISLKKDGASRGAVLSFLISTPTTGVDSILATYSLMGLVFTFFRIFASFFAALMAGMVENLFATRYEENKTFENKICKHCAEKNKHKHTNTFKLKGVFLYGFGELLTDSALWLLSGILIGGIISYLLPKEFISNYMGNSFFSMIIMFIVGIPMYVCATGSIPIAAALLAKGVNLGAVLVFLMAGPATNIVSLILISKNLGARSVAIYLSCIAFVSISLGMLMDKFYGGANFAAMNIVDCHKELLPQVIETISVVILICLIIFNLFISKRRKNETCSMAI